VPYGVIGRILLHRLAQHYSCFVGRQVARRNTVKNRSSHGVHRVLASWRFDSCPASPIRLQRLLASLSSFLRRFAAADPVSPFTSTYTLCGPPAYRTKSRSNLRSRRTSENPPTFTDLDSRLTLMLPTLIATEMTIRFGYGLQRL